MRFFFFKQKTAYEMRISDWSSDVCSSDLDERTPVRAGHQAGRGDRPHLRPAGAVLRPVAGVLLDGARWAGAAAFCPAAPALLHALGWHDRAGAGQDRKSTRLNSSH